MKSLFLTVLHVSNRTIVSHSENKSFINIVQLISRQGPLPSWSPFKLKVRQPKGHARYFISLSSICLLSLSSSQSFYLLGHVEDTGWVTGRRIRVESSQHEWRVLCISQTLLFSSPFSFPLLRGRRNFICPHTDQINSISQSLHIQQFFKQVQFISYEKFWSI